VKKTFWLLLILCLLFSLTFCSNAQLRLKSVVLYEKSEEEDAEELVLENEFLELRFITKTGGIVLKDKTSGKEWYSTPKDAAMDAEADVITMNLMQSQFSLQYSDVSGVGETLFSNTQSIERGFYEYEIDNGALEVRYTIGNLSRNFYIPPAMPEDRMLFYLDQMETDDRRKIEVSYRLYDINNLRDTDNRSELLSNYPDIAQVNMYVLRSNTQDFMKELFEEYFAAAGYTRDDYYEDMERYTASSGADTPAFNIVIRYTLDGKSLVVNVPFSGVTYRAPFPIVRLDLLPFMGAGGLEDEGYLFVPDGTGALINFNNNKQNQIPFNIGIYGWDEATPRAAVVSDSKALFPVFGIQKNDSALMCIIEEGSAYASVRADVSGRNCSYNRVYPSFEMIHGALMNISGRSDRAVYLYESTLPENEGITLRYTLCTESGYVGMAKEYRSWLLDKYPELGNRRGSNDVPVAVEIIGAVNKTQHRLGIPFDLPLKLTSYSETEEIINNLAELGWRNVNVKLNGWFNRSVDHSVPTRIKLISDLGSRRNFSGIVSAAEKNNFSLFPEADFLFIKDVKTFSGYSLYRDSARYVSRERIEKYPYSFVWFGERTQWGKLSHIARPASMISMIDNFVHKSASLGMHNIAFRNIGSKLSGDYNAKRRVSREAAMHIRQEKLAELKNSGVGIWIKTGFSYSVPWASIITDMMLEDQSFGITDASVPFFPIVLHGLVPFTGKAINLAEDYTKNLLRTVESGAGLYFSFMTEETAELQETKFRQFYANEFHKWVGDANTLYNRFSDDFGRLYNQSITNHLILSDGVTITEYEDGTRVIVNISSNPWNFNGRNIAVNSYIVLRRGE